MRVNHESPMIGQTLGHYRVLEKIGEGGMGVVYRAHDERLDRDVALKVLPAGTLADDTARKRLRREALALARLNHPHIEAVHDFDTQGKVDFLVMEYVPGATLADRLVSGALEEPEVLRLGQQVAAALEEAHGLRVVHRDLKPGNIKVTAKGQVKVLDFGLAALLRPTGDSDPTRTASETGTAGTVPYMAPEQLRGQSADARSDLWALGVTLYEMASGTRPFRGETAFELSSAILSRDPLPLPPGVSAELGAVIVRCLEKEPAKRYQRAEDLQAALEAVRAGTAAPWAAWRYRLARRRWLPTAAALAIVTALLVGLNLEGLRTLLTGGLGAEGRAFKLAVLPFENLTGDPEQEFLSDGMTQELISELGRLHPARMSVIGRSSVIRYKKSESPIDQIGRELGVGYILEGTCRREGVRVRISVELTQVRDQAPLWTETYERDMAGLLALQSDIARQVARALALKLLPGEEARLAKVRAVDPEAYEAYLRAAYYRETLTKEGFDAAERYLSLALQKAPDYAAAWAGIGSVWVSRQQMGVVPPKEAFPRAKAALHKALELDDTDVEANRVLAGYLSWAEWDWEAADKQWRRVFELDPNYAAALPGYAHFLMNTGRPDEAMAKIKQALELDPFNTRIQSFYAMVLLHIRRYDDAITAARKAMSSQRDQPLARNALVNALFMKGMYGEIMTLERERWARDREVLEALERGYAETGFAGARRRQCEVLTARYGSPGGVTAYTLAMLYAQAGDKDRVIEWLGKAFDARDGNVPYMGMPVFHLVRSDPRFLDLVRRVGIKLIAP
jgi:TolB-like protein/cytochrome c-type biogenesis protein CcmH/NrfG